MSRHWRVTRFYCDRTFSSWVTCQDSETWTRLMPYRLAQARILGGMLVARESACIELQVKNHSANTTTGLHITLDRHLHLLEPAPKDLAKAAATDLGHPRKHRLSSLYSTSARTVSAHTWHGGDEDEDEGEVNDPSVLHVNESLTYAGLTLSKDIVLELPVTVFRPATLHPLPKKTKKKREVRDEVAARLERVAKGRVAEWLERLAPPEPERELVSNPRRVAIKYPPPQVEIKYDIESARGGRGRRVTAVASIWAEAIKAGGSSAPTQAAKATKATGDPAQPAPAPRITPIVAPGVRVATKDDDGRALVGRGTPAAPVAPIPTKAEKEDAPPAAARVPPIAPAAATRGTPSLQPPPHPSQQSQPAAAGWRAPLVRLRDLIRRYQGQAA
ncbi:hypothetical protein EDB83DRAFT_2553371 [Lactarius deliciosus]|nr:hypothetical protein EDB83DRAFT_2553371 [Lactarius deliciosus]